MSKLYNQYLQLKDNDSSKIYLFQSGIFYIFLDKDAIEMSKFLNLKLNNLNESVLKCGFPINSLEKYMNILKPTNYKIEIVNNISANSNKKIEDFLHKISNINPEILSIREIYTLLEDISKEATSLYKEIKLWIVTILKIDHNLKIYQKYLELIYYSNNIVRKYPKSERFTLVQEIKNSLYTGLRNLMYSIKLYNKNDKLKYLNEFDINLTLLKVQVRLSYKYQYITLQNYQSWSALITEICNMLGGWINSCLKR